MGIDLESPLFQCALTKQQATTFLRYMRILLRSYPLRPCTLYSTYCSYLPEICIKDTIHIRKT